LHAFLQTVVLPAVDGENQKLEAKWTRITDARI
jgi:hypothetical protein